MIEANLSRDQNNLIRSGANLKGSVDLYPSYKSVQGAKQECYPTRENIITCGSEDISLQALIDLTAKRLPKSSESVIPSLPRDEELNLTLVCEWGCDGSSGQSVYKQVAPSPSFSDASLFITSAVPLQLFFIDSREKKVIVWQNPRPASARYCRPLKFQFTKESIEHIKKVVGDVKDEIKNLTPTKVFNDNISMCVQHELHLTMVDGKVANVVTDTKNSQSCNICGAKPNEMNDLENVLKRTPNAECYALGLSSLHARIRTFELFLHVAYRLDVKKWRICTAQEKESVAKRKKAIQEGFRTTMGLVVDEPKQGFGSSNDGNTARTFVEDPDATSNITGLDTDILRRFSHILGATSSSYQINVPLFNENAMKTAQEYVPMYPWYPMSPTVHKLLVHGGAVIEAAPLPISMYTEESQESRNKDCKRCRLFHTRKSSRENCNEDLLHMILVSSDPLITFLRKVPPKKQGVLPSGVIQLRKESRVGPVILNIDSEESSADSSSDEDTD